MRRTYHELVEDVISLMDDMDDVSIAEVATKIFGKDVKWNAVDGTFIIAD